MPVSVVPLANTGEVGVLCNYDVKPAKSSKNG